MIKLERIFVVSILVIATVMPAGATIATKTMVDARVPVQLGAARVNNAESEDKGQTLVVDADGQVSLGAVMVVKDEFDEEAVEDGDDLYPSLATTGLMISNAVNTIQSTSVKRANATNPVGSVNGVPVYVDSSGLAQTVNVSSAAAASTSGTSLMNEGAVYKTIDALDVSAIGGGGANGIIKQVSESNGKISATAAQIVDADVSSTAEIADSKIKLGTVSLPQSATTIATGDALNTALGKLQKQITVNATTAAGNVTDTYSATGTTPVNGTAVNEALKTLDVSSAGGNGNVIVSISETDGKISATAGKISNAEVADNAAIAVSKISGAEATANKSLAADAVDDSTDDTKKDVNYPTVAGAKAIADAAIDDILVTTDDDYASLVSGGDDLIPSLAVAGALADGVQQTISQTMVKHTYQTEAGSDTVPVWVDTDGTAKAITSYSGTATNARRIPSGSPSATNFADIWVE